MSARRLAWYDVDALTREALTMDDVCARGVCAAPTVHLLAELLREATGLEPLTHETCTALGGAPPRT